LKLAVVVALCDRADRVPLHVQRLLEQLYGLPAAMVLVCRQLDGEYAGYLRNFGRVILPHPEYATRFGAYQAGIAALRDPAAYDRVLLLDNSFIAFNPSQLCARAMSPPADLDAVSLSMVHAPVPCLQSHWLSFEGSRILGSSAFRSWWGATQPGSDQAMTQHFVAGGFRVGAMFRPDRAAKIVAVCRALACGAASLTIPDEGPCMLDPDTALSIDPTIFAWDALFAEFGVLSLELIKSFPYGVNITSLRKWIANTPGAAALVDEALRSQVS